LENHPCPICFEVVDDHWSTRKVQYHREDNHSWHNASICDGHDICWNCLARCIQVQVLSEGKCAIRCPGIQCHYHLLQKDLEYAMWGSSARDAVLDNLTRLRNESCQERLKETVFGTSSGLEKSDKWLLGQCQPCPHCFVLCRRETGCDHIVCRCGCDFCFGCGSPSPEEACLCHRLVPECRSGRVFFAAWLRSSYQSPCEWLWEDISDPEVPVGPSDFMPTLGFWLWLGGAEIPVVWEQTPEEPEKEKQQSSLPPLQWTSPEDGFSDDESDGFSMDELYDEEDWWTYTHPSQYLAGHLRKEIYSYQAQRSLRRRSQSKIFPPKLTSEALGDESARWRRFKANRTLSY